MRMASAQILVHDVNRFMENENYYGHITHAKDCRPVWTEQPIMLSVQI